MLQTWSLLPFLCSSTSRDQHSGLKTEAIHLEHLLYHWAIHWTQRVQVDTGSFAWHKWATSFSCPVLTFLWHCRGLLLSLGLPRSWIVWERSHNSTLFSQTWSMQLHHKVSLVERSKFFSVEHSKPIEVFQSFELERSTPHCTFQRCTQGQQSPFWLCPLLLFSSDSSSHCRLCLLRGRLLEIVVTTLATLMGHLRILPTSVSAS